MSDRVSRRPTSASPDDSRAWQLRNGCPQPTAGHGWLRMRCAGTQAHPDQSLSGPLRGHRGSDGVASPVTGATERDAARSAAWYRGTWEAPAESQR